MKKNKSLKSVLIIIYFGCTTCAFNSEIKITPLSEYGSVDTSHNDISGLKFVNKTKLYLIKAKGTNKEIAQQVYKQFLEDTALIADTKKYDSYYLYFLSETNKFNLSTIAKNTNLLPYSFMENEMFDMYWDNGKLFHLTYVEKGLYQELEINK